MLKWFTDLIRSAFFAIDSVIYGFISSCYNFLLDLAKVQIFTEGQIQEFATRIYAFLGVIMIFKLTVSMVQYVAAPEKLETDGKKLVMNILISLLLMVIMPGIVFPLMTDVQQAILDDGIIEQVILGVDPTGEAGKSRKQGGRMVAFLTFSTFYSPTVCQGEPVFVPSEKGAVLSAECVNSLNTEYGGVPSGFEESYLLAYEQKEMKMLEEWLKEKKGKVYLFDYSYFLSTAVGVVVLFILLRFCFDIALRSVKLGFLQLIAPIPIISYADPKTKKTFDTYVKEYISTYLSLFMRLAALYFAVMVISMITQGTMYTTNDQGQIVPITNFMTNLFIIIGCLMFASEVPKLLEKLLGISAGSFSMNPFKNSPLAAAAVGGVAGAATGGLLNFAGHVSNKRQLSKDFKAGKMDEATYLQKVKHMGGDGFLGVRDRKRGMNELIHGEGWNRVKGFGRMIKPGSSGGMYNFASGVVAGGYRSGAGSTKGNITKGVYSGVMETSKHRRQRAAGYGLSDKISDVYTDMAGIEKKTGTTSEFKDRIKTAQQALANYQRDEANYARAMGDIQTADIKKTASYMEAFKEAKNADGTLITDKTNGINQLELQSYNDYIRTKLTDQDELNRFEQLMSNQQLTEAERNRRIDEEIMMGPSIDWNTTISRSEYESYDSMRRNRDMADYEGKKLEKEIKGLQELQELGKKGK